MNNVKLPVSNRFSSQMKMHTGTTKYDVSLAKEFQQHLTKKHRKYGAIDQIKYIKRFMERRWTHRHYHVQDNAAVEH